MRRNWWLSTVRSHEKSLGAGDSGFEDCGNGSVVGFVAGDGLTANVAVCYAVKELLHPPVEGHHVASRRMIEAGARAGIDARVVTIERNTSVDAVPVGWTLVGSRSGGHGETGLFRSFLSVLDEAHACFDVASRVKNCGCDLVHVLNVTKEVYMFAHEMSLVRRPVLLHFYHSPYVLHDDVFFFRNLTLRFGLFNKRFESHAVTVNKSLCRFLTERLHVDSRRVHYVPYPIDTQTFKPLGDKSRLREKHGLPPEGHVIVYVGSLHPARGLSVLLKSFYHLLFRLPKTLLYISHPKRKGEEAQDSWIKTLVCRLKMQDNVRIIGPSPNIEEVYNLATIVALPFQRPYWVDPPIVLLEAMSCGAAVVTSAVGSIDEIVRNHQNAILANVADPMSLAETMVKAIENCNLSEIRRSARQTIVRNYSYQPVGTRLSNVYNYILGVSQT